MTAHNVRGTVSPHPEKTSSPILLLSRGGRVRWPDVLRAVQDSNNRSLLVRRMRDAGFSADDFSHSGKTRQLVADILTKLEDGAEGRSPTERDRVRAVRRRLEWELWP